MIGAIVFLAVFVLVLLASLGIPTIPPDMDIFKMLNLPLVDYPVLGIPATVLAIAVFYGIIYAFIVWLLCSITLGRKKSQSK